MDKETAISIIEYIILDCKSALDETWDRSDSGFTAMKHNAELLKTYIEEWGV